VCDDIFVLVTKDMVVDPSLVLFTTRLLFTLKLKACCTHAVHYGFFTFLRAALLKLCSTL